jgi:O-antigen/teichoic acid export membrane protein
MAVFDKKKLLMDSIIIFVFNILALGAGYFTRVFLSKNISLEAFGLFYALWNFYMFLGLFVDLGFSQAMVKFLSENKGRKEVISITFFVKASLSIILSAILFFSKSFLSQYYFKSSSALLGIDILIAIILISTFTSIVQNYFHSKNQMFKKGLFYFLEKASLFLGVFVLIFFSEFKDFNIPIFSFLLANIFLLLISLFYFFKINIRLKFNKKLFKKMSKFALFSSLTAFSAMILGYVDALLLTGLENTVVVGIYSSVLATVLLLSYFASSIATVLFPKFSESYKKSKNQVFTILKKVYFFLSVVLIPICITTFIYAKEILTILYTSDFISGSLAMKILVIGVIPLSFYTINHIFFSGIGKPEIVFKTTIIGTVVNLILNIILIPFFSLNGAAIATTIAYVLIFLLTLKAINKFFSLKKLFEEKYFRLIVINLVFVLFVLLIKNLALFKILYLDFAFNIGFSLGVYGLLVLLSRTIKIKEMKDILFR